MHVNGAEPRPLLWPMLWSACRGFNARQEVLYESVGGVYMKWGRCVRDHEMEVGCVYSFPLLGCKTAVVVLRADDLLPERGNAHIHAVSLRWSILYCIYSGPQV
jgi:hypothetical protein